MITEVSKKEKERERARQREDESYFSLQDVYQVIALDRCIIGQYFVALFLFHTSFARVRQQEEEEEEATEGRVERRTPSRKSVSEEALFHR